MRRCFQDRRGSVVVEFAILAPVFLICLFGVIEGARMIWTNQALNEAAYSTARCRAISATGCTTLDLQVQYAIDRARENGVTIAAANVAILSGVICRGNANSIQVTIQRSFSSPAAQLLPIPGTLAGRACMPVFCAG